MEDDNEIALEEIKIFKNLLLNFFLNSDFIHDSTPSLVSMDDNKILMASFSLK